MFYLISYDIQKDSIRTRIAKLCVAYGFQRIQFSVFAGEQSRTMVETFSLEAHDILGKRLGKIVVIPICLKCFEKIIYIGEQEMQQTKCRNSLGMQEEEKVMIV